MALSRYPICFVGVAVCSLFYVSEGQCQPKVVADMWGVYPKELDIGIYWYGPDDTPKKATGEPSSRYDPTKKTVIYFPGWAGGGNGWTIGCTRATSRCPGYVFPDQPLLADKWLDDGWNFGMFYWDQFADEKCVRDAEQKIWLDRGNDGIRWKSFNMETGETKFVTYEDKTVTVGDLCVQYIESAMKGFTGPNLRFVGHSLGTQLAAKCADMLHVKGSRAAPDRLALLEPYFSTLYLGHFHCSEAVYKGKVGDRIPKATADVVKDLWDRYRVPTEVYKSSALTENEILGNTAAELESLSVLVKYVADWCGELGGTLGEHWEAIGELGGLGCRHTAMFPYYFLLYNERSPILTGSAAILPNCGVPSSACSDTDIQELAERQHLMGGKQSWLQVMGMATRTMNDDAFKLEGPAYNSLGTDLLITTTTTSLPTTSARVVIGNGAATPIVAGASTTAEVEKIPIDAEAPEIDHLWAGVSIVCIIGIVASSYYLCSLTNARRISRYNSMASDYTSAEEDNE